MIIFKKNVAGPVFRTIRILINAPLINALFKVTYTSGLRISPGFLEPKTVNLLAGFALSAA